MIIATSGMGSSFNYNCIISSVSSNSVIYAESKTYKDTTLFNSKRLYALFIFDKNIINSLIWDNISMKADLATLNLGSLSVTYKQSLPVIKDMRTSVFISAYVYYTPVKDTIFY